MECVRRPFFALMLGAQLAAASNAVRAQTSGEAASGSAPPRGAIAVLQGLDKITARISIIEAPIGETVRFGTLDITVRTCHKNPPEEAPETAAFLEILEQRDGRQTTALFTGWMFASSPALSALEHPVYDVRVSDCRTAAPDESAGSR